MTPQKQLFLHRPEEGQFGDCWRAAIACLIDQPVASVPHFAMAGLNGIPGDYMVLTRAWLAEFNLYLLQVPYSGETLESVLDLVGTLNPGVHYLLTATKEGGVDHNVVCLDKQIVWDPSLEPKPIIGPASDGHWWVSFMGALV